MGFLILAILIMGFSGIAAQILFLREMLVTFHGNELSIGIILANWLILEAIGSFFLGKTVERMRRRVEGFVSIQFIFAFFLPIAIFLIRNLKDIFGVGAGEGVGLPLIFFGSFLVLLPISITHGALFTFSCKLYNLYIRKEEKASISRVYIYETIGTILGGLVFTYLLVSYFNFLQIALGISLLNFIFCVLFLNYPWQSAVGEVSSVNRKILGGLSIGCVILTGFLLFSPAQNKLHLLSLKNQWKAQDILYYRNSIYGNVAVTQRQEQHTFYKDGIPVIITPAPDLASMEEFAHLSLLFHASPKKALLISGGAGGLINEILKHPSLESVDYVELDPLILKVVKQFSTPLTLAELTHPKAHIHYIDGRLFLKKHPSTYDIILVGLSFPSDLQTNRFFTKEFFSLAKKQLKGEGILVVSLPGSLTYLSEELKNLNACVLNALKEVFANIRVIPGDGKNLFLASASSTISLVTPEEIIERLEQRNIKPNLLLPDYIKYRLHPRWQSWFLKTLLSDALISSSARKGGVNQDFEPRAVFYSLSYWNALFSPYFRGAFKWMEKISFKMLLYVIALFTLGFLGLGLRIKKCFSLSIPYCIATTGFAGMIFNLALIFAFQSLYGYAFHWIGLLVTAFMVGVVCGSLFLTRFLTKPQKELSIFLKVEIVIIFFSFLLSFIFLKSSSYLDRPEVYFFFHAVFLILSFFSGLLAGAEFSLAAKIRFKGFPDLSSTAGLLYSADLLGGWLGGILGGVLLLPLLGLVGTCMVVGALKVSSLIIFKQSLPRNFDVP